MKFNDEIRDYNYRVDISFRNSIMSENKLYMVEFPEFWIAEKYAKAIQDDENIKKIYLLERISDGSFDITRCYKKI